MENKSHALIAGLFTVLLGIALGLAAMWFSRDHTTYIDYELVTRGSVSGLAPESPVRFRGVGIGKVSSIHFDPSHPGQILVDIAVDPAAPITKATYAQLAYQGVTGLSFVELDDDGSNPERLATSADALGRIDVQPGLLDKLSGGSQTLINGLQETVTRLNMLLNPENQKALMNGLASFDEAAKAATALTKEFSPTLARLPGAVDESRKTLAQIAATAESYQQLAARLQDKEGALARLSQSLDDFNTAATAFSTGTLPRVNALSEDATRTARSISRATEHLNEQPQSLLFGRTRAAPGPGEPGFVFPQ